MMTVRLCVSVHGAAIHDKQRRESAREKVRYLLNAAGMVIVDERHDARLDLLLFTVEARIVRSGPMHGRDDAHAPAEITAAVMSIQHQLSVNLGALITMLVRRCDEHDAMLEMAA